MQRFLKSLYSTIFHDVSIRYFRYLHVCACFLYSCHAIELGIITNLSSNERGGTPQPEKLEINLHGKANTCHLLPAMVKFISECRSSDPMRTLLFLFFEYYSRFEARLLRYMEKIGRFSSSFKSSICQFSYLLYLTITLSLKHNSLTFIF